MADPANGNGGARDMALGRLQGTVDAMRVELDRGSTRINELTGQVAGLNSRLQTLVETAGPQRERMINDLDEIKDSLATMAGLPKKVDEHGKRIEEHDRFRAATVARNGLIGGIAGLVASGSLVLLKYLLGDKP